MCAQVSQSCVYIYVYITLLDASSLTILGSPFLNMHAYIVYWVHVEPFNWLFCVLIECSTVETWKHEVSKSCSKLLLLTVEHYSPSQT